MTTPSDEELLHHAREDEDAIEELYRRWAPRVAGLARAAGVLEGDRADVVQRVFTELWRHARRFDPARGSAETWILTLARRRVIDALRIRGGRTDSVLDESDGTASDADRAHSPDAESAVDDRAWLSASLAQLSDRERHLLELEYWGGFTQGELARMWKVPLGTLKTWNRRALGKLRTVMVDSDAGGGV
jgi:RNA polymerase sigma-70 factor (ECF subfamily)